MLVTQRLREAYTHLDDDRVSITYPAVMTEIDAIRALRTQDASACLASDPSGSGVTLGSNSAVREAVEEMLEKDWIRTSEEFEDSKREIWAANDLVFTSGRPVATFEEQAYAAHNERTTFFVGSVTNISS
jgi:hypothetical protein